MLHVVGLAFDERVEVQHHTLGIISLTGDTGLVLLQRGQLFLVALTFALEFRASLLLHCERLESVITLLRGADKAVVEAICVGALLLNERRKTSVLALVVLDRALESLTLASKILNCRLELEELLSPTFELFHEEIVSLCDFTEFGVHAALEVDVILPSLNCVTGVLVPLANDFVEVTGGDLCHQWLLSRAAEDLFDARIATLWMIR